MIQSAVFRRIALAGLLGLWAVAACDKPAQVGSAPHEPHGVPALAQRAAVDAPRLVILGFDGVDPRRVESLIAAGRLPHLQQLGDRGHRGVLQTTNPPQSPVAWAAFATGMSPGEHGIFDFIARDAATYLPRVATTSVEHAHVQDGELTPANARNLRRGDAFWDVLARAGVAVRTLFVPYAYPPPPDGAWSVAGLGTSDVRGINSSFTLLTTDRAAAEGEPPAGGQVALLEASGPGVWQAFVEGPRIQVDGKKVKAITAVMVRAAAGDKLEIEAGGARQQLAVGDTGSYQTLTFAPAASLQIKAATRFTVRRAGATPEIYVEPLSNLPAEPYLPLAAPPALAVRLWQQLGPFKTVGWVHDTSALGAGAMDEDQFLREAFATMQWRRRATLEALREHTDRVLVSVFTTPDRIGHMFYRYIDPVHPGRPGGPGVAVPESLAGALDASYDVMDAIVGDVLSELGERDTLVVVSDHGFGSFRRGLNINRWLVAAGYMTLKTGVRQPRDFFLDVDWQRTRAYALGTGGIFLNLQQREGAGIVPAAAAAKLLGKMARELRTIHDGSVAPVLATYLGDALYEGPMRRDAPDLRVALADGYRASWDTTLGGIPAPLFDDNLRKWSGDHASARPEDVPGIFISNRPIKTDQPRIEDIAATAFELTGVARPARVVGRPLWPREESQHATRP